MYFRIDLAADKMHKKLILFSSLKSLLFILRHFITIRQIRKVKNKPNQFFEEILAF